MGFITHFRDYKAFQRNLLLNLSVCHLFPKDVQRAIFSGIPHFEDGEKARTVRKPAMLAKLKHLQAAGHPIPDQINVVNEEVSERDGFVRRMAR